MGLWINDRLVIDKQLAGACVRSAGLFCKATFETRAIR